MSYMTMDKTIASIKRQLGVSHLKLPVTDDELITIIVDETIPTFSQFYPYEYPVSLSEERRDHTYSNRMVYYVDDDILNDNEMDILGVTDLRSPNRNRLPLEAMYGSIGIEDMGILQMQADMVSLFENGTAFKFIPPNKVEIINSYINMSGQVNAILMTTHSKNLTTISPTKREDFITLAVLDMKAFLFPILSAYSNIETTFGTINLNIDNWSDAADRRKDLVEKWKELYLNDRPTKMWVF